MHKWSVQRLMIVICLLLKKEGKHPKWEKLNLYTQIIQFSWTEFPDSVWPIESEKRTEISQRFVEKEGTKYAKRREIK